MNVRWGLVLTGLYSGRGVAFHRAMRLAMWGGLTLAVVGLVSGPRSGLAAGVGGGVFDVSLQVEAKEVAVDYKGQRLVTYRFGTSPFKPYVRELYSLDGVNVLVDAPPDHLHHHGLMYGIKVNGVNYWEETPESGSQQTGPEVSRTVMRDGSGRPVARFSHRVRWVPGHTDADRTRTAVLVESRVLSVSVDEAARETALEWASEFEVGSGPVALTGAGYHGLGLRLNAAFNGSAKRRNAAEAAYTQEGTWDVKTAAWEALTQAVGEREVTVTLFDDDANAGEPRLFSMLNPFAYVSATQGLERKPLEYGAGARFRLRYLVTVHGGEPGFEALRTRQARWLGAH